MAMGGKKGHTRAGPGSCRVGSEVQDLPSWVSSRLGGLPSWGLDASSSWWLSFGALRGAWVCGQGWGVVV